MYTETPTPIPKPPLPVEETPPPAEEPGPSPIYNEIVVEPPLDLEVFLSYSPLPDRDSPSFAEAIRPLEVDKGYD